MRDFRGSFPVSSIDRLRVFSESNGQGGFADAGDFVLDVCWKSAIILMTKSSVTPLELSHEPRECDIIFCDVITFLQMETLHFRLSFSDRVVQTKVGVQLIDKDYPAAQPDRLCQATT
jgi:hypothetical protein